MVDKTRTLMEFADNIAEASFLVDSLFCAVDILHKNGYGFQQVVPEFIGCHSYEQRPFQYSLHIEYEDGDLDHFEYLAKEGIDPDLILMRW